MDDINPDKIAHYISLRDCWHKGVADIAWAINNGATFILIKPKE